MTIDFKKIQIDEELADLLPKLSEDDSSSLTQSLLDNGFDQKFGRIKVWFPEDNDGTGYIVDGHNRYKICSKNGIELSDYCFEPVYFDSKEDVIKWMLENQLARRNLQTIQRIAIAEKYRPIFEKQAKERQSEYHGNQYDKKREVPQNFVEVQNRKKQDNETNAKLAKMADVNRETYRQAKRVLDSDNEEVKRRVLSGKTSISAGYRELRNNSNENSVPKKEEKNTPEQRIIEADNRMNEIDRKIADLKNERENLMRKRSMIFESLDIECELKYEFFISDDNYLELGVIIRECRFYIETDDSKQIFVECGVYPSECPDIFYVNKIPERYKNDFLMLWKKAYKEDAEYTRKESEKKNEEFKRKHREAVINDINKCNDFYKQCYRILAKCIHPDTGGSVEAMQCLNQLKVMWGI